MLAYSQEQGKRSRFKLSGPWPDCICPRICHSLSPGPALAPLARQNSFTLREMLQRPRKGHGCAGWSRSRARMHLNGARTAIAGACKGSIWGVGQGSAWDWNNHSSHPTPSTHFFAPALSPTEVGMQMLGGEGAITWRGWSQLGSDPLGFCSSRLVLAALNRG